MSLLMSAELISRGGWIIVITFFRLHASANHYLQIPFWRRSHPQAGDIIFSPQSIEHVLRQRRHQWPSLLVVQWPASYSYISTLWTLSRSIWVHFHRIFPQLQTISSLVRGRCVTRNCVAKIFLYAQQTKKKPCQKVGSLGLFAHRRAALPRSSSFGRSVGRSVVDRGRRRSDNIIGSAGMGKPARLEYICCRWIMYMIRCCYVLLV